MKFLLRREVPHRTPRAVGTLFDDLGEFGGDEVVLLVASLIVSLIGLVTFLRRLRHHSWPRTARPSCAPFYLALLAGFTAVGVVIAKWADPQIRENVGYLLLVPLMGAAWLVLMLALLPWFGLSLRDDLFERRNEAAAWAISGAALGILLTYCGANIGTGPSFWNNVFSVALASGGLLLAWVVLAEATGAAASVTVERDPASGVRIGGFFVAVALVLARAVAGDWTSATGTAVDFLRAGWPALLLLATAMGIEFLCRPGRTNPSPAWLACGCLPAVGYLALAALMLVFLGWW